MVSQKYLNFLLAKAKVQAVSCNSGLCHLVSPTPWILLFVFTGGTIPLKSSARPYWFLLPHKFICLPPSHPKESGLTAVRTQKWQCLLFCRMEFLTSWKTWRKPVRPTSRKPKKGNWEPCVCGTMSLEVPQPTNAQPSFHFSVFRGGTLSSMAALSVCVPDPHFFFHSLCPRTSCLLPLLNMGQIRETSACLFFKREVLRREHSHSILPFSFWGRGDGWVEE